MRIVFFTGAGVSRESGLNTFRDVGGLWEGYSIEEVCSVPAWQNTPERVLDFYNVRRREVLAAAPNVAHDAIAALEESHHEVTIVTQNIDDLHERAGSRHVLHLHGEILKSRSVLDEETLYACRSNLHVGNYAPDGGQLRPHVVFFGETIYNYASARSICKRAHILVIIGTSLSVYPAAYLVKVCNANTVYVVDPNLPNLAAMGLSARNLVPIKKPATEGVDEVLSRIQAKSF